MEAFWQRAFSLRQGYCFKKFTWLLVFPIFILLPAFL